MSPFYIFLLVLQFRLALKFPIVNWVRNSCIYRTRYFRSFIFFFHFIIFLIRISKVMFICFYSFRADFFYEYGIHRILYISRHYTQHSVKKYKKYKTQSVRSHFVYFIIEHHLLQDNVSPDYKMLYTYIYIHRVEHFQQPDCHKHYTL